MAQLAELLRAQGILLDAIKIYERMLELNPNDNQGVRDPLRALYLETGNLGSARKLLTKYCDDGSASFAWSRALERFLAGASDDANAALKQARRINQHVELFLTANKALPKDLPEMYSLGSEEEAVLCINCLTGAWAAHRDAVFWMFDVFAADGLQPSLGHAMLKDIPPAENTVQ
jgi:tetratricopeptide (TPR) repeat protein